ncbi:MAG TPA: helix-turn-helix domain-containing protein [Solirubrobacterales bacterium]|nr:helix-turn-helix domain-containing protein [Solirubrobacterales bacterium]
MKRFGRLLRRLRGRTPLPEVAHRMQLAASELTEIEAGRVPVDRPTARRLLRRGFALPRMDVERLILGVELYDLGLKDNEIRQLVIAVIRKELPEPLREELKALYRRTTEA